jgi:DNA-binding transcriptional MerR regulator
MPVMPGGAFGAAPMREGGNPAMEFEERAFRLRMRAREIEHQMQNLKFELETVRLEMEHLERTRAQGGGERGFQPRREGGWPPEARNPENLERQAAETKARLEHLRQQWNEARERGERERARDLGGAIEELQGALEEMRRGMEKGGNRPPEQDGRREEAAGAIRELEAHIEMLRDKLARAEKARDKEGAGRIREEIEKTMRRLTDLRGKDVDQKRGEVAEKAIHRLRELEERVARARSEGDKGAVKELMNEIEKVHEILRRAKGEGEKRPEKKPRMM